MEAYEAQYVSATFHETGWRDTETWIESSITYLEERIEVVESRPEVDVKELHRLKGKLDGFRTVQSHMATTAHIYDGVYGNE